MEEIVDRIWEKFLTDRDRAVLAASGNGSHGGFGKKPALLVIDVSYGFTGDKPAAAHAPPAKSQKEIRQPAAARAGLLFHHQPVFPRIIHRAAAPEKPSPNASESRFNNPVIANRCQT
jgi:hypothetical protein